MDGIPTDSEVSSAHSKILPEASPKKEKYGEIILYIMYHAKIGEIINNR